MRALLQGPLGSGIGGGIGGIAVVLPGSPVPLLLSGGGIGGSAVVLPVVLPVSVPVPVDVSVSSPPLVGLYIGGISLSSLVGPAIGGSLLWLVVVGEVLPVPVPVLSLSLPVLAGVIGTAVAALSPSFVSPQAAAPRAAKIITRRTRAGPLGGGVGRGMSSSW